MPVQKLASPRPASTSAATPAASAQAVEVSAKRGDLQGALERSRGVFAALRFDESPAAVRTRAEATATLRSLAQAAACAEAASPNRGGVSPDFETGAQKMVAKLQGWTTGRPAVQQEALRMLNLSAESFSNEALLAISRAFVARG
ncbi:MAG: hypothetical protein ACOZQL_23345 [Myxococcota bacterium]